MISGHMTAGSLALPFGRSAFIALFAVMLAMGLGLMARPAEAAPFAYVANVNSNTVSGDRHGHQHRGEDGFKGRARDNSAANLAAAQLPNNLESLHKEEERIRTNALLAINADTALRDHMNMIHASMEPSRMNIKTGRMTT
jgi:hypothetical protein